MSREYTSQDGDDMINLSMRITKLLQDENPDFPTGMGALCVALGNSAAAWGMDEQDVIDAFTSSIRKIYNEYRVNKERLQ